MLARPAFYDAVHQLSIMPSMSGKAFRGCWRASDAAINPVGSGHTDSFADPRAAVELVADTANYRGAPKLNRLIWSIAPDFQTALTRLLTGETTS